MKTIRFLSTALVAGALLSAVHHTSAQGILPGSPGGGGGLGAATAPVQQGAAKARVFDVILQEGSMAGAIEELQRAITAAGMPDVNVLYGPGVAGFQVPRLILRNVSGTDALRLLAVSAGCTLEAIDGESGEVIGFRLVGGDPNAYGSPGFAAVGGMSGGSGVGGHVGGPHEHGARDATEATPGARPAGAPGYEAAVRATGGGFAPGMMPGGSAYGVIGFGSPAPRARVYPLGGLLGTTAMPDVEETLRQLFSAEGIAGGDVKLAFHEKTKVLVATGTERAHELVGQLLEALQKNAAGSAPRMEEQRELIEARIRIEAMSEQYRRLERQLEVAEAERREVARELERMKAATQKSQ